jgi:hypothetical protein
MTPSVSCLDLSVEIRSYWHVASGNGNAAALDAVACRDALGLPFLPGRSVKGLLRAACEEAAGTEEDAETACLFGREDKDGKLRFEDARLEPSTIAHFEGLETEGERRSLAAGLFRVLQSTAVTEGGTAKPGSLRSIEAVVPVTLRTCVYGSGDCDVWRRKIKKALPLVVALGAHRRRGFGQCYWRALGEEE